MKTITGNWLNPAGVTLAGAVLNLILSQDCTVTGTGQIAPGFVPIVLDSNGDIPAGTQILGNDELSPAGTYYTVTVVVPNFGTIYGPELWSVVGVSPINVNDIVPVLKPLKGTICSYL